MKRILGISTDQQLLDMLDQQLSGLGFQLEKLESNDDLLNKVKANKPDILLIDFLLGDQNAAAVGHQIPSDPDLHGLPIIILSDLPGIDQLGAKIGSFAVIKKPMATALLAENIVAALTLHAHTE